MAKTTVAELEQRIDQLEQRIAALEAASRPASTRAAKQRDIRRYIDDAELEARRAAMAKARAEAMAGHVTAKVTW